MSKRNYIVERASDVNGGQYVQTNSSYNSGYEDGKKAGKEYCASEIEALREQVEKLTMERDEWKNDAINGGNAGYLREQLAALSEQNEKLKEALENHPGNYKLTRAECAAINTILSLPDLATPVLNRIRADGMKEAFLLYSPDDTAQDWVDKILARADELEKTNG